MQDSSMVALQSDAGQAKFNPSHQQWDIPLCVQTSREESSPLLFLLQLLDSINSKCLYGGR